MTKKNTSSKKQKTVETARGPRPGPSPDGGTTQRSDALQIAARRDPRDGTAVIAPVTDAMLDHAAHEAAGLAGGIARPAVDRTAALAPAPDPAEPTVATTGEAARDIVEPAGPDRSLAPMADTPLTSTDTPLTSTDTPLTSTDTPPASAEALGRYNAKLIAMMRSNAAATAALFTALIEARSVPEALSINADHLCRQMATLTDQGAELASLAQRIAGDTLRSFTDAAER